MKKLGLGRKLVLAGALSGALVLGTVIPANAGSFIEMGPYATQEKCKTVQRTYTSSWTKIVAPCFASDGSWWFGYRTR
ncbi:hypothetical protein [Microbacterium sp. USTB-Y]|uniref:hypothetical protein n=1 Tax=Microbacterium sp. USTB-Y TaxID=2823692 RepID=UPI00203ACD30|nr:hypothetical protein [Microbacterium sp. USTB-Y]